jgi:DNA-binding transcriptional ArsR family regulator
MAFSKRLLYHQELQIISHYARALGFPGRLDILLKLHSTGPLCVQDIAVGHPICKETLSEHLKLLRETQLIAAEERYPYTIYHLDEYNMEKAKEVMNGFLTRFS